MDFEYFDQLTELSDLVAQLYAANQKANCTMSWGTVSPITFILDFMTNQCLQMEHTEGLKRMVSNYGKKYVSYR